jgi:hypothetical protein
VIVPRHRVALLLLAFLLAAGPLAGAAHRPAERQPRLTIPGLLSEVWVLVGRLWRKEGSGTDPFGKSGSSTDPFGNPKPPSGNTSPEPASGQ